MRAQASVDGRTGRATDAASAPLEVGAEAVVAVAVAGIWRSPESPRAVDGPALANPPDLGAWLAAMDDDTKRDLVGRLDTQVLLGERVVVTDTHRDWLRVLAPDQPSDDDARGYPGWIPRAQLTSLVRARTPAGRQPRVATVVDRMASVDLGDRRFVELSFGARLAFLGIDHVRAIDVALPDGPTGTVEPQAVAVHDPGAPPIQPSATSIVDTARRFLGLPYLWAGRSGFGFDCSGLVHLVHALHGIVLPRDTGPQSRVGELVEPGERQAGDLVFFERHGDVHHVVMWIGDGMVIESPRTGLSVRELPLADLPYASEVTVTRRVLPPA